jgi:hypothetical protein
MNKKRDFQSEYMMLTTASQFLTAIQKIVLQIESPPTPRTDDINRMVEQANSSSLSYDQVQTLQKRLQDYRSWLEEKDESLEATTVRRLFEEIGAPDQPSFERLIRFYLTKQEKSVTDRDKLDILTTRWGSFHIPGPDRLVFLRSEPNLKKKLEKIFSELEIELDTGFQLSDVTDWLDTYRSSLLNLQQMSDIVDKNYKGKLREFKLALGQFFYHPVVLAEVVDTNVTLHNVLQEFYLSERSRLDLYVDHAKRKPPTDTGSLSTLMIKAEEMRRVLDETQAAIASQMVVDQAEAGILKSSRVEELVALLEQTLKQTNELSQQIQQEIAKK